MVVTSDFHAERARLVFERAAGSDLAIGFRLASSDHLTDTDLAALRAHEQAALSRLLK